MRMTNYFTEALSQHQSIKERSSSSGHDWNRVFTLVIFALFVVALLVTIVMGTQTYSSLASQKERSEDQRIALNLITNSVKANDGPNSVQIGNGPEGRALVLAETLDSGSYETRFYLYQGNIVEEYSLASSGYTPEKAVVVAPSQNFDFTYANGLLTINCDQGSSSVAIRSAEGGA